ncbi:hypothetical protein ACFPZJ_38455 [Streptomyces bullii]|uniref:Uncharacterized protein n=1 Tax=Streptomyces bullii TaxID=349910 RepID=A0ABW0V1N9_9ACTN
MSKRIVGVDVAVAPPDPAAGRPRTPVNGGAHVIEPPLRITLLAQDAAWARLCRLVSAAHAEADGAAPVVFWPTLRAYADQDLVVLLGPASEPVRAPAAGRIAQAVGDDPIRAVRLLAETEATGQSCTLPPADLWLGRRQIPRTLRRRRRLRARVGHAAAAAAV